MGDFTGFTFGDWHSSDPQVGDIVVRVSGGDRYEEQLHPEIKDITAEVPGRDGEYYFGSDYGPKTIDIEIAFDSLTEKQFRDLRRVFGTKKIKELIFDERPYKKYMAKIESPIELSYICFDEPKRDIGTQRDGVRVANRKGKLSARIANQTFREIGVGVNPEVFLSKINAIGNYQFLYSQENHSWLYDEEEIELSEYGIVMSTVSDNPTIIDGDYFIVEVFVFDFELEYEQVTPYVYDYSKIERIYKGEGKISFICYFPFAKSVYKQIPNGEEESDWAISSGILSASEYTNVDKYNDETGIINIYNAGDIETGFRLYLPGAQNSEVSLIYKENNLETTASLVLKPFELKTGDAGVLIDTINELIVGVKSQIVLIDGQEQEVGIIYDGDGNATYETSGNIYNEYIKAGYFFHLQPNFTADYSTLEIENGITGIKIFYDYLYF